MKYHVEKSAIAEHAWTNDHPINWAKRKILEQANRAMELVLKVSNRLAFAQHLRTRTLIETSGMSYSTVGSPHIRNLKVGPA